MKKQSGFTLIELMIVVAIIAILAAIALPAYQNYTREARYSEMPTAADSLKTAMTVCYAKKGDLAGCDTLSELGLPGFVATDNMLATSAPIGTIASGGTDIAITLNGTDAAGDKSCIVDGTLDTTTGKITWDFDACSYDGAAAN